LYIAAARCDGGGADMRDEADSGRKPLEVAVAAPPLVARATAADGEVPYDPPRLPSPSSAPLGRRIGARERPGERNDDDDDGGGGGGGTAAMPAGAAAMAGREADSRGCDSEPLGGGGAAALELPARMTAR